MQLTIFPFFLKTAVVLIFIDSINVLLHFGLNETEVTWGCMTLLDQFANSYGMLLDVLFCNQMQAYTVAISGATRRQRQTSIKLPITPPGWNGSSASEDIRQYLSYFSEIAFELSRHLLQFVLISCSCAVAISSKRSAVAHTESEEHLHACIPPHLHWECPTTWKPAQHYYALWKSGTTPRWLNGDSTGAKHLSALLAGGEGWLSTILLFQWRQAQTWFMLWSKTI